MAEAAVAQARVRIGARELGVAIAIVAIAVGVLWWALSLRGIERTNDAFVEGHLTFLSARVAGQIADVRVTENQRVRAGDVLVRLDTADFEARVAQARADVDAARNSVTHAHAAADAAAAQEIAAAVELRHAEQELERARGLFARGVASQTALDAAQAARDAAEAERAAARERERAERAVVGNEAPVRQAEARLREAELALEHAVVTAPFDGTVGRRSAEVGSIVSPGQPLVAVLEDGASWITANFKETQIAEMDAGDPAEVRVDAFPGAIFRGRVESLSPATGARYALLPPDNATGNFTKVVQRVPVRIALESVEGKRGGLPDRAAGARPSLPVGLSVDVRVRVR